MAVLELDVENALYYEHATPSRVGAPTFVFVNALTGSTAAWEGVIGPHLRALGFGTLSYNFRGQDGSTFSPDIDLTPDLITSDLTYLVTSLAPKDPILVGLSIGGLFAAQAHLDGLPAKGLVLLNTLRKIGPRLEWVGDAMPTIVSAGGVPLFLDALFPLLVNPDFAAKVRDNFLKGDYAPLDPTHGHANLMRHANQSNWDIPYGQLKLPTLVITGHHDRVFLDVDVVDELFAKLPHASREDWHDAGHLLPQEVPEKLAESLAQFGREREDA